MKFGEASNTGVGCVIKPPFCRTRDPPVHARLLHHKPSRTSIFGQHERTNFEKKSLLVVEEGHKIVEGSLVAIIRTVVQRFCVACPVKGNHGHVYPETRPEWSGTDPMYDFTEVDLAEKPSVDESGRIVRRGLPLEVQRPTTSDQRRPGRSRGMPRGWFIYAAGPIRGQGRAQGLLIRQRATSANRGAPGSLVINVDGGMRGTPERGVCARIHPPRYMRESVVFAGQSTCELRR